ncbi:MAG: hypothetical protein NTY34_02550 [Candidatus Omnitrophica bacterium]|nr:hypothetical protein [Candidatus Omnitrophota bacterium]
MKINFKKINFLPIFVFSALSASFFYLLFATWFKWGGLLVDTFRDPLTIAKLINGKVLYKDIFYEYGFFPPYFLTFVCKMAGMHLNTMVGCGIALTILMSCVLYKISRFFLDVLVSGLVVFTFLFVFAFGFYCYNGIFNFILPYSFASVFFILFIALAVYFFIKFIFSEKNLYLWIWSMTISLAIFSRIEMALLAWAGFIMAGIIFIYRSNGKRRWRVGLCLITPLFIGILGYSAFLFNLQVFNGFKESIVDLILFSKSNLFIISGMGLDNISQNAALMLKSFFLHIAAVFILGVGSYLISIFFLRKESHPISLFLGIVIITAIFTLAQEFVKSFIQYNSLPLFILIGTLIFFMKSTSSPNYRKNISLFALFLTSLIMVIKIFFNASPNFYGFYLLPLGLVCYYIIFFGIFRGKLEERYKYFSEPFFFYILACFFIVLAISWWKIETVPYSSRNLIIHSEKGSIKRWGDDLTVKTLEAIVYLRENTNRDAKVIVVPEGGAISFFSGRENPLKYSCIMPQNFGITSEDKIISQFSESHADYIVIVARDTSEYGASSFGVDYAIVLNSWIKKNYELLKLIGPYPFTTNHYGIAIFKKK